MTANPLANLGRCQYCGLTGDATLFKTFNTAGNSVCKATAACTVRQSVGQSAAGFLSALLRAVRTELPLATTEELAELVIDLGECRTSASEAFYQRNGYQEALNAAQDHRAAHAARKTAKS